MFNLKKQLIILLLGLALYIAVALRDFILVQESIKHFPVPLRKSLKVIAEGDFLVLQAESFCYN